MGTADDFWRPKAVHMSIHVSIYISTHMSVHMCAHVSIHMIIHMSKDRSSHLRTGCRTRLTHGGSPKFDAAPTNAART